MPVSKTIWRGKVGTPEKCACISIVPISGVPVSDIYCTMASIHAPISKEDNISLWFFFSDMAGEIWEQIFEFPSLQAHLPQGPWQMALIFGVPVTSIHCIDLRMANNTPLTLTRSKIISGSSILISPCSHNSSNTIFHTTDGRCDRWYRRMAVREARNAFL